MSAEQDRDEIAQEIFEGKCGRFPTFAVMEGEPQIPGRVNVPLARAWARAAAEQAFVETDVFLEERARRQGAGSGAKPKRAVKPVAPPPGPDRGPVR